MTLGEALIAAGRVPGERGRLNGEHPMRNRAIVCLAFAALGTIVAIQNIMGGANRPEDPGRLARYAVGSFLVPMALLIVGLILWGNAKKG
jgi:hypothetical protein